MVVHVSRIGAQFIVSDVGDYIRGNAISRLIFGHYGCDTQNLGEIQSHN